jgi:hypothetical protein
LVTPEARPIEPEDSTGAFRCARHPDVETYLRCGRCETPICPKCLVYTPVGTRCADCAKVTAVPTYTMTRRAWLLGGLAAVVAAGAIGIVWALLDNAFFFTYWGGLAVGFLMAEVVGRATNRKRGWRVMTIAVAGVLLAMVIALSLGFFLAFDESEVTLQAALAAISTKEAMQYIFFPTFAVGGIGAIVAALRLR